MDDSVSQLTLTDESRFQSQKKQYWPISDNFDQTFKAQMPENIQFFIV